MSTKEKHTIKDLRFSLSSKKPEPAGPYIQRFFKERKLSALSVSKKIGCSASTLTRLFAGGALSVDMASKLEKHYLIDSKLLFDLEAQSSTFKAKEKLKSA